MNVTIEVLAKHQKALVEKFGESENIAYSSISFTQLSTAKHFGGCNVNGKHYVYNPTDDSLIREDVLKFIQKTTGKKTTKKVTKVK